MWGKDFGGARGPNMESLSFVVLKKTNGIFRAMNEIDGVF